ncbi:MAG: GNAT family N-acetyltransferase [Betaproteobacteria bacterium]|nr:GNAT family N-acetyltransferase [Betaproteobacteria bacterium]
MTASYRFASPEDAALLAPMNWQLIRDEGHRNAMGVEELRERMAAWLRSEYQAVVFEQEGMALGYALFRHEAEFVYLRQLFVIPSRRGQGVARRALTWLWANAWPAATQLRIDVLIENAAGRKFWLAMGFREYCVTMEAQASPLPAPRQML